MSAPTYSIMQFLLSQVRTSTEALVGGSIYFYAPGTTETTGIKVYLDEDGTEEANNPYTLDADGTAQLYGAGSYRIVIKDAQGVTQFDRDNVYFNAGSDYSTQVSIGSYDSLAIAVASIGASSVRLVIDEAITVTSDLTVPANIILERVQPGTITVSPGATLTIVSSPISDASQWFYGAGTVSVTGYPQDRAWWGETQKIWSSGYSIYGADILSRCDGISNCSFTASVESNALTVALVGMNGSAPSSTNPIYIAFHSTTATTAIPVIRTVTSATSVTLSSGSTLGFTAAETGRIYVWAIDNGGTVELALSRNTMWYDGGTVSTTAEGGSGAADSASTMYSTTARTTVPCKLIGAIRIQTGATPGEWANAPSRISLINSNSLVYGYWSVPYANSNGALSGVSLGAAGTVLASNGADAAPSFGTITGSTLAAVTDGTDITYYSGGGYDPYVGTTPVKIWEYVVGRKGVFRLVYTFTEAQTRVRTYIDGTEYGDLRTSSGTYTETITVEPGNKIQIWGWSTTGSRQLLLFNVILTCNDAMYLAPGGKLLVG